ncbi:hypothetical protein BCON_0093g00150 [Botryotinia convoluta]|uniref:Xylanolytic transcriptional activator regulatory domain-containing protein n=1 Tax=Botryotinia convoluta TaxID=54673 RepID=A0A4Z1IEY1_9HELO|nr:hypothetical protein BCON_0093g00150 [Botryotinia convoluta]
MIEYWRLVNKRYIKQGKGTPTSILNHEEYPPLTTHPAVHWIVIATFHAVIAELADSPAYQLQVNQTSQVPSRSILSRQDHQGIEELNARLKRLEELLEKNINVSGSPKDTASVVSTQETPAEDAQITNTVSWLESDAFEHRGLHESTNYNLLCYDDEITQTFAASFLGTSATIVRTGVDAQSLRSLPSRKHARVLFDYFVDNIVWIYHIIHIPTLESHLNRLYDDLDQNLQPQNDHVALLSAVFALSLYFQGAEPLSETRHWTLLAQKALCAANFIGKPTMESIQAVLLIAQHLLPNIGGIATFRVLFTTAMHSARSLGFDQLDSTQSKKRRVGKKLNYVELETKRRIWWHIVSTDWQVHLYQLSIICREIVDAMQTLGCEIHELPYETVLNFDRKLISMVSEIPPAFRLDAKSRAQYKDLDSKHPFLAVQRTAGHFGVQTRFTRLHRPYLARGAHDPRFSYSRMVCLRSARSVIELGTDLTEWGKKQNFQPVRMWTVTHHIFVATVILVMDFCLNKDDPRSEERKAEIMDAFKMLESCQETSTIARRGLEQLRDILRRGTSSTEEALAQVQDHRNAARDASSSINSSKQRNLEFRMPEPMTTFPGLNINDPCSRVDWENIDFDTIEDINFDTDLSASDFEALFHDGIAPQCG